MALDLNTLLAQGVEFIVQETIHTGNGMAVTRSITINPAARPAQPAVKHEWPQMNGLTPQQSVIEDREWLGGFAGPGQPVCMAGRCGVLVT